MENAVLLSALVDDAGRSKEGEGTGRARVADAADSPAAVLNSKVEYEDAESRRRSRITLVHPADADANEGRISVLSPVGRALLGLRTSQVAEVTLPNGDVRRLKVVAIEAARRA